MTNLKDTDLLYAATARCRCGAGLAYPLDHDLSMRLGAWVCSRVLKGEAQGAGVQPPPMLGVPAETAEHDSLPWAFYKVREETSIRNTLRCSTRPPGTVARTVGNATCPKCSHKWHSEPYDACGQSHHWFPGPCPNCAYAVAAEGSWSTKDGDPIEVRFRDVVIAEPVA